MKYQVLIPTHHKTNEECFELANKLNVKCSCLIVNQTNCNKTIVKNDLTVINIANSGVSNNRNNLLKFATGDICICIDDDCPLVDNYLQIIENNMNEFPFAEFLLFNGVVTHENNRLVHNKRSKIVHRFHDISYGGGPGLVFKREAIKKYNLLYNVNVGYPNKIEIGEDTLFLKSLIDKKVNIARSKDVLFIIKDDVENSVYFTSVDKQFILTKGCIAKVLHPYAFFMYKYICAYKLLNWRDNKFSFFEILKYLRAGSKKAEAIIK